MSLEIKDLLWEANEEIEHVYFLESGVCSIVTVMADGGAIEVATVGREGMASLPVFLGARRVPVRCFAQIAGEARRMSAARFRALLSTDGKTLSTILRKYTQGLMNQIAQTAACNRGHRIEARCARWLLMTHDRVDEDTFPLTQEFLAQMLGVRRSGVSEVASALQSQGFIRYVRGQITMLDRRGLEEVSCECYSIIKREHDQILERTEDAP